MELDPKKKYVAFVLSEPSARILDATLRAMKHLTDMPKEAFPDGMGEEFIRTMLHIGIDLNKLISEIRESARNVVFGPSPNLTFGGNGGGSGRKDN